MFYLKEENVWWQKLKTERKADYLAKKKRKELNPHFLASPSVKKFPLGDCFNSYFLALVGNRTVYFL